MLEGDSQLMAKILGNEAACPVEIEVIVEDISRAKAQFQWCGFQFVQRVANAAADKLASESLRGDRIRTWEAIFRIG